MSFSKKAVVSLNKLDWFQLLSLLESRFVSSVQAGYWPQHSDATFSLFSLSDVPLIADVFSFSGSKSR